MRIGRTQNMFCLWLFSWIVTLTSQAAVTPTLYRQVDKQAMTHWVDSVFDAMNTDERIGQLFMVIANPKSDAQNMQKLMRYINEIKIGGILFHKGDAKTQAEVTNRLQKASRIPLLIALDGEWGLSMRLTGTTRFPRNMMLGALSEDSLIEAYGREVARQCREMGIHINFAPVIDVNCNADNPVIGTRSFGEDPIKVAAKGITYAKGLEQGGIISVAKHFPGHGDTSEDSHYTLPALRHDRERLEQIELYPFRQYIQAGFAGVMTGHLYVPALDVKKNKPASMSRAVVTDLLEKEMGFTGLRFSDALAMKGASTRRADNPSVQALLAGNDILLAPAAPISDYAAVKAAIEEGILDRAEIEEKVIKILQYKYVAGLNNYQPIETKGLNERLNTPHAAWLTAHLHANALTLAKNENEILPLKQLNKQRIAAVAIGDDQNNEFQEMAMRYDSIACFSIGRKMSAEQIARIYHKLESYDVILCGIHTVRIQEHAALRQLAEKKKVILVFFTSPYFSSSYKQTIRHAKAVLYAYEGSPLAQQYAAQLLFGGIAAQGTLPITIPDLYPAGTGLRTEKTRLGYQEPEEVGIDAERLEEITKIVHEGLDAQAYPGCQVLVAKKGMIIYDRAFGYHDYKRTQAVNRYSVYDLASASKASGTLLAVMHAFDNKKFALTDRLSSYFPEFKGSDKENLTIQELLYHQSGLPGTIAFYQQTIDKRSYTGNLFSGTKDVAHPARIDAKTYARTDFKFLPELISSTRQPNYTDEVARGIFVHSSFRDSIIQQIKRAHLNNRGGYRYSCINFILLKLMVERQMKEPMDQLLHRQFFRPMGAHLMTYNPLHKIDTLQIVPTETDDFLRKQTLRGYVHDEAAAFQGGVSGNAGLFSNANDLAKVLQLYLNEGTYGGERYLSTETCHLFTHSKSATCRRGLGFDKPAVGNKNSPCGDLAPASVYGHTGFTGTCFWIDPDQELIYIFLSNRVTPSRINNKLSALDIRTRIQDVIYQSIIPQKR